MFEKCSQNRTCANDVVVVGGIFRDVKEVSTSLVEQIYKVTLEIDKKTRQNIV